MLQRIIDLSLYMFVEVIYLYRNIYIELCWDM